MPLERIGHKLIRINRQVAEQLRRRPHSIPLLIVFLGFIARIPSLFASFNAAHTPRTVEQVFHVRMWLLDGFDPLSTRVPGVAIDDERLIHFPAMSYVSYLFSLATHGEALGSRLASIVFFQLGAYFLFCFTRNISTYGAAIVTLTIYVFTPFGFVWSASTVPDVAAVTFFLASLTVLSKGKGHNGLLIASCALFSLALAVKPIGLIFYIPLIWLLFLRKIERNSRVAKRNRLFWVHTVLRFTIFLIGASTLSMIWLTYVALTKPSDSSANAETLTYLYSPLDDFAVKNMATAFFHEIHYTSGSILIFSGLVLFAVSAFGVCRVTRSLMLGLLIPVLVIPLFMHKYAGVHAYFASTVQPSVAALCAFGLISILGLRNRTNRNLCVQRTVSITSVFLASAWLSFGTTELLQRHGWSTVISGAAGGAAATLLFVSSTYLIFLDPKFGRFSLGPTHVLGALGFVMTITVWSVYSLGWRSTLDNPLFLQDIATIKQYAQPRDFIIVLGCSGNSIVLFESLTEGIIISDSGSLSEDFFKGLSKPVMIYQCQDTIINQSVKALLETNGFLRLGSNERVWKLDTRFKTTTEELIGTKVA